MSQAMPNQTTGSHQVRLFTSSCPVTSQPVGTLSKGTPGNDVGFSASRLVAIRVRVGGGVGGRIEVRYKEEGWVPGGVGGG